MTIQSGKRDRPSLGSDVAANGMRAGALAMLNVLINKSFPPTNQGKTMKPTVLTKSECVRRARNLNQQAVSYRLGGKPKWARELIQKRKQYMAAARLFA